MRRLRFAALAVVVGGALAALAGAVFPVGNYMVYGSVLDWSGNMLDANYFSASEGVTVMAVRTNNTVVATTTVASAPFELSGTDADWCNYRLVIPLGSAATGTQVKSGEKLTIVIVTGTGTYRTEFADAVTVGGAGEGVRLDFRLADDADGDGIPDQYVDELASFMDAWGYETFDLDADWDGDGKSNREEYLAGTDPTDENDCFALTLPSSRTGGSGGYTWPIAFEAKSGRTYCAVGTGDLSTNAVGGVPGPVWTNETFLLNGAGKASSGYLHQVAEPATTTFWMMPVGDRHFWKVLIGNRDESVRVRRIEK